jgi:hypothetical protein
MRYQQPIKQILAGTRELWDHGDVRQAARDHFNKVVVCRTPVLGAERYASQAEEKLVYHTCKSPFCPSCGHKATELWQHELQSALPDIPYSGIVFTMPNVLWPIFQRNRHLLHDLPAVGAQVIQQWVKARYGVRVLIIVMPHTFGRHLDFKPHLHILVSGGGLQEGESRWIPRLVFNKRALMHMWRYAVITYLRQALQAMVLSSELAPDTLRGILKTQYERWWNIDIQHFKSKRQFLRYAGRYVRRPPIAQHRFLRITDSEVVFWTNDLREKRRVETRYSLQGFIATLTHHVPDRYRHAMRYFGLLAPRSKGRTSAAMFVLLGQRKPPRPRRLGWVSLLRKHFGVDPLIDGAGQRMHWVGRLKPAIR